MDTSSCSDTYPIFFARPRQMQFLLHNKRFHKTNHTVFHLPCEITISVYITFIKQVSLSIWIKRNLRGSMCTSQIFDYPGK